MRSAVTLSHDSQELIVDPGTGSNYGNPLWRTAFWGTRAHATVCVDGLDQSEIGGRFYWSRHAVSTVRSVDLDRGIVDAQHDGYRRLDDPVAPSLADRRTGRSDGGGRGPARRPVGSRRHGVVAAASAVDVTATDDGHLVTRAGLPCPPIVLCGNRSRSGRAAPR